MTVPDTTKKNVIRQWLEGIPRDEIASNNGISVGMVSAIVTEARSQIVDIDLLRELALNLRKTGLDLDSFAFAVRLQNKLNKLEISEDMAESAIEKLHLHCFTKNLEIPKFLSRLDYLMALVNDIGVPLKQLDKYIFEKIDRLKRLDRDIQDMAKARSDMASIYQTTIPDLEEFQQLRPIHGRVIEAENENSIKDIIIKEKEAEIRQLKEQLEKSRS